MTFSFIKAIPCLIIASVCGLYFTASHLNFTSTRWQTETGRACLEPGPVNTAQTLSCATSLRSFFKLSSYLALWLMFSLLLSYFCRQCWALGQGKRGTCLGHKMRGHQKFRKWNKWYFSALFFKIKIKRKKSMMKKRSSPGQCVSVG